MPLGFVYEIFDKRKPDESVYVGSTSKHPFYRWAQHICTTFRNESTRSPTRPVHAYMFEQGPEHFDFRVLEDCFWKDKIDLLKREQVWIDERSPRCNRKAAYLMKATSRQLANHKWGKKPVVCECGARLTQASYHHHRKSKKHIKRMQEIALAKLKDKYGALVRSRSMVLPARTELPCPTPPEGAARVEAQAEADHSSGEVP